MDLWQKILLGIGIVSTISFLMYKLCEKEREIYLKSEPKQKKPDMLKAMSTSRHYENPHIRRR